MDNEMKRRVFLTSLVGALIGVPVAVRLIGGAGGGAKENFRFVKELKKYRKKVDVAVRDIDGASTFRLPLAPPVGTARNYVLFCPTVLPDELSNAVGDDPDTFFVNEGRFAVYRNNKDQIVLAGGEDCCRIYAPQGTEEHEPDSIMILLKDGELRLGKPRGLPLTRHRDIQLPHLLSLLKPPKGDLYVGKQWKGPLGRVRPFSGYVTSYEVAGFSEIELIRTVKIAFSAHISNVIGQMGVNSAPSARGDRMTNSHQGHAWFDLETGLLVRQEAELESATTLAAPPQGKQGQQQVKEDTLLTFRSKMILQLFSV